MRALVISVLAALVRVAGVEHMRIAVRRHATAAIFWALALVSGIAASLCVAGALWWFLLPKIGPAGSYLAVAGVLLLLTVAFALAAKAATRMRVQPNVTVRQNLPALPLLGGGNFASTGMPGLASAVIAGFLVGLVRGRG